VLHHAEAGSMDDLAEPTESPVEGAESESAETTDTQHAVDLLQFDESF
jgi:hypothetical protein